MWGTINQDRDYLWGGKQKCIITIAGLYRGFWVTSNILSFYMDVELRVVIFVKSSSYNYNLCTFPGTPRNKIKTKHCVIMWNFDFFRDQKGQNSL